MVGAAAEKITPAVESWTDTNGNGYRDGDEPYDDANQNGKWDTAFLAGFGNGRAATGVHDDVWARAITLQKGDVSIGMVAIDCVGYFQQYVLSIRKAAEAAGLDFDHIMVSSTHVHESHDTMGMWGKDVNTTGIDPEYMDLIVKQAVSALKKSRDGQKKATMKVAQAQRPELVNDTRLPKVVDQNINAVQFLDESGAPITTAILWGNHPESLGSDNTMLTSDFPHYVRDTIEKKWPGAPAVFFNGPLGGLTTPIRIVGCPDAQGNETCPQGTWERAEYVGKGAAEAAIAALEGPDAKTAETIDLAVKRRSLLLPVSNTNLGIIVLAGVMPRDVFWADGRAVSDAEFANLGVAQLLAGDVVIGTEINGIDIGPVSIATVPGELYTELWLEKDGGGSFIEFPPGADYPDAKAETPIQASLPKGQIKMIINNANDAIGYIIPLPQWDAVPPFDYDPKDDQYGEENSSGYQTAGILTGEFVKMYSK